MHIPARRRPEFDAARYYEYLRTALADMPSAPGVYLFHGEEGDLPLYIGCWRRSKSEPLCRMNFEPEGYRPTREGWLWISVVPGAGVMKRPWSTRMCGAEVMRPQVKHQ